KRSTFRPRQRAARKCPSSWTKMSRFSASSASNTTRIIFNVDMLNQFLPPRSAGSIAGEFRAAMYSTGGFLSCPGIGGKDLFERGMRHDLMRRHHAPHQLGDLWKVDFTIH